MITEDKCQDIIDAWRQLDNKNRVLVAKQLASLVESNEIETELNHEHKKLQSKYNDLPGRDTDKSDHHIFCGDISKSSVIQRIQNRVDHVDMVFTSPPYNADIAYDVYRDKLSISDYMEFLCKTMSSMDNLIVPGGRLVINIRDISVGKGERFPIIAGMYPFLKAMKYCYRGLHIWYKGREESSFSWGSWRSSSNPAIIDLYEYVFVFQKEGERKKGKDDLNKTEFIENVIGVWKIRPVKKIGSKGNRIGHPCPFPVELARRAIKLYSHVGDTILDPFGGIVSTSIAAAQCGRNSVSVDISEMYCKTGVTRFKHEMSDMIQFGDIGIHCDL